VAYLLVRFFYYLYFLFFIIYSRVRYGAGRGGFSLARPRPYNGPGGLFWG